MRAAGNGGRSITIIEPRFCMRQGVVTPPFGEILRPSLSPFSPSLFRATLPQGLCHPSDAVSPLRTRANLRRSTSTSASAEAPFIPPCHSTLDALVSSGEWEEGRKIRLHPQHTQKPLIMPVGINACVHMYLRLLRVCTNRRTLCDDAFDASNIYLISLFLSVTLPSFLPSFEVCSRVYTFHPIKRLRFLPEKNEIIISTFFVSFVGSSSSS